MIIPIQITKDFINQRDARAEKYNPRGRSLEQLKLDIECEVLEWHMMLGKSMVLTRYGVTLMLSLLKPGTIYLVIK